MKASWQNNNTHIDHNDNTQPAHVGDVHGRPRHFPLRHMYPPPSQTQKTSSNQQKQFLELSYKTQNYYLPISSSENWPRCPRCHEAARPAVLMFEDLDWVFNLNQERRWKIWCHSLFKLCKYRSRGINGGDCSSGDDSTVYESNDISENDWEDASEHNREHARVLLPPPPSAQLKVSASISNQRSPQTNNQSLQPPSKPLNICILEIGCGYNVPTCRLVSETLLSQLLLRGGNATLIRINPLHPEADDPYIEDNVISIMEKGLVALREIDEAYCQIVKGCYDNLGQNED